MTDYRYYATRISATYAPCLHKGYYVDQDKQSGGWFAINVEGVTVVRANNKPALLDWIDEVIYQRHGDGGCTKPAEEMRTLDKALRRFREFANG